MPWLERSPALGLGEDLSGSSEAVEAITGLELDQTANLEAEARHDRLVADAGANAEPISDLEFDQTLGW